MVSLDPPERNREFAESVGSKMTLLSDPDGKVARAYGVLAASGKYAQRWSFFIDRAGVIRRIDRDVSPDSYGTDLLKSLDELGFERKSR